MCKMIYYGVRLPAAYILLLTAAFVDAQDTEGFEMVTVEMFNVLQAEVNDLYGKVNKMHAELEALGKSITNLAKDTEVVDNVELGELQALIDVSNKQEGDINSLKHFNGIWQNNFRVINKTFAAMRKGVSVPRPALEAPQVKYAMNDNRVLPRIQVRNVTAFRLSPKPIGGVKNITNMKTLPKWNFGQGKPKNWKTPSNDSSGGRRNNTISKGFSSRKSGNGLRNSTANRYNWSSSKN